MHYCKPLDWTDAGAAGQMSVVVQASQVSPREMGVVVWAVGSGGAGQSMWLCKHHLASPASNMNDLDTRQGIQLSQASMWQGQWTMPWQPRLAVFMSAVLYAALAMICRLGLEVQDWYRQQLEAEPVRFMETTGMAGKGCCLRPLLLRQVASRTAVVTAINSSGFSQIANPS